MFEGSVLKLLRGLKLPWPTGQEGTSVKGERGLGPRPVEDAVAKADCGLKPSRESITKNARGTIPWLKPCREKKIEEPHSPPKSPLSSKKKIRLQKSWENHSVGGGGKYAVACVCVCL